MNAGFRRAELLPIQPGANYRSAIERAAEVIADGGVVAFPTETVYGLGCDARCAAALARIRVLKGREEEQPFQILVAAIPEAEALAKAPLSRVARKLMRVFWPGALTLVLPAREGGTVGLRLPDHNDTRALLRACRRPLAATSANLHGQGPARSAREVEKLFGERIELILDGPVHPSGQASTVAAVEGDVVRILREGAILPAAIHDAAAHVLLLVGAKDAMGAEIAARIMRHMLAERAPGMRVEVAQYPLAPEGEPLSPVAKRKLEEMGYPVEDLPRVRAEAAAMDRADWIVFLEKERRARFLEFLPDLAGRAVLLEGTAAAVPPPPPFGLAVGPGYHEIAVRYEEAIWKLCKRLFPREA
ncbi:MAG: L-threonylcarbamoyladenylate synthase [Planctomycetota bacterium]